ncbi:hypothetical protein T484DRAFT_1755032 [Baffinella frigidus]|nr:hypothetical protein T484DRAFT_1755032 [Cryptophyta sp. CCMP2293]
MGEYVAEQTLCHNNADHLDRRSRVAFDTGLNDFFDPAVDEHSEFYYAMQCDKHAAHLVAGTSFLSLNNVILTTECNNAYESMNEEDMQKLRKLMWNVYVPTIQAKLAGKMVPRQETTDQFQLQMYVVHLSIRVSQALQLIFELNQKKSFSAVAKTAYEVALQDVLYHPGLKGKIKPSRYRELINFLRRHPAYSTAFNTYVGYKLLRQQLVRSGGAGTNRKSNDAERLHDEAANRLWGVLDENRSIFADFENALRPLTMEWHEMYYKEVAETLFNKLANHDASTDDMSTHPLPSNSRDNDAGRQAFVQAPTPGTDAHVDIVDVIQEVRQTAAEGPSKRVKIAGTYTTATLTPVNGATAKHHCSGGDAGVDGARGTGGAAGGNTTTLDDVAHSQHQREHEHDTGTSQAPVPTNNDRMRRAYDAFFH